MAHLTAALRALSAALGPLCISSLYRTEPISDFPQPEYLNLVVLCRTALAPLAILDLAQELEHREGRRLENRSGPRTLDIDLLVYGSRILDTPRLRLPHPRLRQRRFVLAPFCEVAPDFPLPPDGTPVHRALAELAEGGKVEKVSWSDEPELLA